MDEGENHLKEVVRLAPDRLEAHQILAALFMGQNRRKEAATEYSHLLRLAPDWPEVLKALVEIGYNGWYSWEDEPEDRNPFDSAVRNREFIERRI